MKVGLYLNLYTWKYGGVCATHTVSIVYQGDKASSSSAGSVAHGVFKATVHGGGWSIALSVMPRIQAVLLQVETYWTNKTYLLCHLVVPLTLMKQFPNHFPCQRGSLPSLDHLHIHCEKSINKTNKLLRWLSRYCNRSYRSSWVVVEHKIPKTHWRKFGKKWTGHWVDLPNWKKTWIRLGSGMQRADTVYIIIYFTVSG